jgi:hypothetical protein
MTYGIGTWEEILRTEGLVTKAARQAAARTATSIFCKGISWSPALSATVGIGGGLLYFFAMYLKGLQQ